MERLKEIVFELQSVELCSDKWCELHEEAHLILLKLNK